MASWSRCAGTPLPSPRSVNSEAYVLFGLSGFPGNIKLYHQLFSHSSRGQKSEMKVLIGSHCL